MNRTALACAAALLSFALPGVSSAADLRIDHATIVSPERTGPMRDASVLVRGGRIVSISKFGDGKAEGGLTIIDATGLYLAPGLIDSHVHPAQIPGMTDEQEAEHPDIARAARRQLPRSFLLYGFTTLINLISAPAPMAQWKASSDAVPDTYFCGGAAVMDGYPMNYAPKPERYAGWPYMVLERGAQAPEGIDAARHTPKAAVARIKSDGAICVKMFFERGFGGVRNLPVPSLELAREVVTAAHGAGLVVFMHANTDEAQAFAVDAGVDVIAHGMWNWNLEKVNGSEVTPNIQKTLDRIVAGHIGWQPTQRVLAGLAQMYDPAFLGDPALARVLPKRLIDWYRTPQGQWFRTELGKDAELPLDGPPDALYATVQRMFDRGIKRSMSTTRYLVEHHGRVLFGTDTPSAPTYANPPGLNAFLEMKALVASGESPAQIFRSATLENARAVKLDREIGTVEVGKRANLLLMREDPTRTIDAYTGITKVILGGRVLEASALAADAR